MSVKVVGSYAATDDGGVVAKSHASDHAVECRNARSELFNNRRSVAVIVLRSCGPIETRTCCGLKIWCCDDYCLFVGLGIMIYKDMGGKTLKENTNVCAMALKKQSDAVIVIL